MRSNRNALCLSLIAGCLYLTSLVAFGEGAAHDQSDFCEFDPFMPPPFLGFEYWSQLGITLAVVASGLLIAAYMLLEDDATEPDA